MSNMDVWSGLRWISASKMTLWHHFHSTSDLEFPGSNALYKSHVNVWGGIRWILSSTMMIWHHSYSTSDPEFLNHWDSIPVAQTLCICPIWIWEVVWGESQPQPWHLWHHFHSTSDPEITIWGQLGQCNGMGAPKCHWDSIPVAQTLLYFCVLYGWLKWIEVDLSLLIHDLMTAFSLLKWPSRFPICGKPGLCFYFNEY